MPPPQPIKPEKIDSKLFNKIIIGSTIFVLLVIGAGAYIWRDNQAKQQNDNYAAQIKELEDKISKLNSSSVIAISTNNNSSTAQRDTQRKNDLSRVSTLIISYSANNRGNLPVDLTAVSGNHATSFVQDYLSGSTVTIAGSDYEDPLLKTGYVFALGNNSTNTPSIGSIYYYTQSKCGANGAVDLISDGTGARKYALVTKLESQSVLYCVDNG